MAQSFTGTLLLVLKLAFDVRFPLEMAFFNCGTFSSDRHIIQSGRKCLGPRNFLYYNFFYGVGVQYAYY